MPERKEINLPKLGGKVKASGTTGFLQLNLLPDVKKQLLKVRRERNLVITVGLLAIGASAAVLVVLGSILGVANVRKLALESSIERSEKTIETSKKEDQLDKYLTVQNQLTQVTALKNSQQIYSRLLSYLTQLNPQQPNNVTLNTITLGSVDSSSDTTSEASGGVSMTIEGRVRSYAAMDVYKTTLANAKLRYREVTDDDSSSGSGKGDESSGSSESTDAEGESSNESDDKSSDSKLESTSLFTSVEVRETALSTSSGSNDGGVSFTIVVSFDEKAFSSSVTDVKVEVPEQTTSDSSRNAPTTNDGTVETFHTIENNGVDQTNAGGASTESSTDSSDTTASDSDSTDSSSTGGTNGQ